MNKEDREAKRHELEARIEEVTEKLHEIKRDYSEHENHLAKLVTVHKQLLLEEERERVLASLSTRELEEELRARNTESNEGLEVSIRLEDGQVSTFDPKKTIKYD